MLNEVIVEAGNVLTKFVVLYKLAAAYAVVVRLATTVSFPVDRVHMSESSERILIFCVFMFWRSFEINSTSRNDRTRSKCCRPVDIFIVQLRIFSSAAAAAAAAAERSVHCVCPDSRPRSTMDLHQFTARQHCKLLVNDLSTVSGEKHRVSRLKCI